MFQAPIDPPLLLPTHNLSSGQAKGQKRLLTVTLSKSNSIFSRNKQYILYKGWNYFTDDDTIRNIKRCYYIFISFERVVQIIIGQKNHNIKLIQAKFYIFLLATLHRRGRAFHDIKKLKENIEKFSRNFWNLAFFDSEPQRLNVV